MNYEAYMKSMRWFRRRDAFFRKYRAKCSCGLTQGIELHHTTYERLGNELDEDLVPLCEACHEKVHQKAEALFRGALNSKNPITRAAALAEASKRYGSRKLVPVQVPHLCETCGVTTTLDEGPCVVCVQARLDRRAGVFRPVEVEPPMRVSPMPTDEEPLDLSPLGIRGAA